jgi:signal transduction histidine kinase
VSRISPALDKVCLLLYFIYMRAEASMRKTNTTIQRAARNADLDITLQHVIDGVEDELVVIDSQHRVRFANLVVRDRFQKGDESLIGKLCYKVFQDRDKPCSAPLWTCPLGEVIQSGSMKTVIHHDRIPGADRYLKITAYPLHDSRGTTNAIVELRRDVAAERELEIQILRRHHQLLALSHISSAVSELWDLETILNVSLDAVLEIINGEIGGILLFDSQKRRLSYRVYRGLSAKYAKKIRLAVGEGIAGRVGQTGEPILLEDVSKDPRVAHRDLVSTEGLKGFASVPLKTKDKVVGVMNIASHTPGRFTEDDLYLLSSVGHQIGTAIEQAKLYERLERARQRYEALLRHTLTAQEEARKRIARELHDETSQALTSVTLSLQAIIGVAEIQGIGDEEFIEKLKTTHSYAIHAGNEIVKLMKELRPTLLDELGMSAAIRRYAKDTLEAQGINVSTEFIGTEKRFQPEIEVTLFRISQGAIGNILKHSEAKNVNIRLECDAKECRLRIEDDGKGFDVNKLTRVDPSGKGAGLFTMKERVSLVGGSCHVESQPGQGTKVIMKIPVAMDVAHEEDKGANS